jgi:AraC-like DNA-binding protein
MTIHSMSTFEIVIRTVGATAAVVLAVALGRARGALWIGRLCGALFCLGVASYLPCSVNWDVCWRPSALPAAALASAVPFFFWGWTRSIMDDSFRLAPLPMAGAIALLCMPLVVGTVWPLQYIGWSVVAHSVIGIAFVIAALVDVVRTWRQDLIEARRRLRWVVLVIGGVYSLIVMCVELYFRDQVASPALQLLNAVSLMILLLGLCAALLAVSDTMNVAFGWKVVREAPAPVQSAPVTTRDPEQELIDRLLGLMTVKAMYRDASLTVASLASALGVPEKRLREIINGRLGHKNFPSYVNAYRLEEVRARLDDTRNDHLPILTMALDAGFGSIVVFNRAFKERYSMTPTEYRAARANTASAQ